MPTLNIYSFEVAAVSRRSFLKVSAAAGSGLMLQFVVSAREAVAATASSGVLRPNAFIRVTRDGTVILVMHKAEMGQGVFTAVTQLIAEELEVRPEQVRLEQALPDDARYGEPFFGGLQMTGGSTSIRSVWMPLRVAAATARVLLVTAAALTWWVDPARLVAREGEVVDPSTGKSVGYGALVNVASTLPMPKQVALKDPGHSRLIGHPLRRLVPSRGLNARTTA
jgi:isoquinoline 1-oxidoreductase subunit beta